MKELTIYTNGRAHSFEGENARKVYRAIEEAGARGAGWTSPISLCDKTKVVYVLNNICFFEYKDE